MTDPTSSGRTYESELLTMMCTMQCMAELAAERGDRQIASILHNAAALLDLKLYSTPAKSCGRLPPSRPTRAMNLLMSSQSASQA